MCEILCRRRLRNTGTGHTAARLSVLYALLPLVLLLLPQKWHSMAPYSVDTAVGVLPSSVEVG